MASEFWRVTARGRGLGKKVRQDERGFASEIWSVISREERGQVRKSVKMRGKGSQKKSEKLDISEG